MKVVWSGGRGGRPGAEAQEEGREGPEDAVPASHCFIPDSIRVILASYLQPASDLEESLLRHLGTTTRLTQTYLRST